MLITFFLLLIIMAVICGAALVYQGGDTALIEASKNGHKDIAIALAERGADLNIKDKVSYSQLCVYDDYDVYDDNDDYDDDAGVSTTLVTFIYMHVCLCMNMCIDVCMYV